MSDCEARALPFSETDGGYNLPTASSLCYSFSTVAPQPVHVCDLRQRRVRFSDESRTIPHDWVEGEFEQTWLTPRDYAETKAANKCIVRAMRIAVASGHDIYSVNSPTVCIRGIEDAKSLSFLDMKRQYKTASVKAVLEEQTKQRSMGFCDPCGLAAVSKACSEWARDSALTFGKTDAEDVYCTEDWETPMQAAQEIPVTNQSECRRKRKFDTSEDLHQMPVSRHKALDSTNTVSPDNLLLLANLFSEPSNEPRQTTNGVNLSLDSPSVFAAQNDAEINAISNNRAQLCYDLLRLSYEQLKANQYQNLMNQQHGSCLTQTQ